MAPTANTSRAVTETIGFNPSEATFPVVDAQQASLTLLEYNAERAKLSLTPEKFGSLGEGEKLNLLQAGYNLLKTQTDPSAIEILEKRLPAHLALSVMLDSMITQAVRADKTIMRGAFRSFRASRAEEYKDSAPIMANVAENLLWGLNFALRGQAGLIAALTRNSEHSPISQRAEFCATIIKEMQQRNLGGFKQQSEQRNS